MRIYDSATQAQFTTRGALVSHRLVWIKARQIGTETVEAMGLWSGEDDISLTLEGELRTYQGAGGLLQAEPITAAAGLAVRVHQLHLAAIAPEVEDLVKGYDTRFAPVEVHRALIDPTTREIQGTPHRVFRGFLNNLDFPEAEPDAAPIATLEVVSETRALTRTLATKKSDESHQARGGDMFRRYGDISGVVPVYWGELRISPPADPAPVANKAPAARDKGMDMGWGG